MCAKFNLKKYPLGLKLGMGFVILLSAFFIFQSFYLYVFHKGTSWNFGGMGMYSSSDYPGKRYAKIYVETPEAGNEIFDQYRLSSEHFNLYEGFVSLPTQKNADKLKSRILKYYQEQNIKPLNIRVEFWLLKYDKSSKVLRSIKELEF